MCAPGHGPTTHSRLRKAGWTRRGIERALADGSLERLRIGVFATAGVCREVRAAARAGGVIGCLTAARHAGLWVLSDDIRVHIALEHRARPAQPADPDVFVTHWVKLAGGIASIPGILRHIARCCGAEEFFVALESALRKGLIDAGGLAWLAAHGNDEIREALAFARDDADSGLESLLRWRLRRFGLQVTTQQRIPSVGQVDLLIGERLIVEADGRDNHAGAERRHHDLVRDANAAAWGYTTLRFDYALIVHDWDLVERAILGALGLRA